MTFVTKITAWTVLALASHYQTYAQPTPKLKQAAVDSLQQFSRATYTDAFMLVHEGETIYHWQNSDCDAPTFNTASMVKSWTGLVIGILIDKGLIQGEDATVCQYIPDWQDGCEHAVTIKDLLTMSAGINRKRGAEGILDEKDMNAYAKSIKLDTLPGVRFNYSNASVQLLSIVIEKASKKTAGEVFEEVLFQPLGMDSTFLFQDEAGNDIVYGGATTTLEDASQVGQFMLNEGKYNGRQIVSGSWIQKSVSPSEHASFYGYLWWLDNNSKYKNFAATGDFGQMTIVFPDLDLVYLRQQTCNKDVSGNMPWMGPSFLEMIGDVVDD
jgi:CubicO group peptidase (beta-lactamase class C family)